MEQSFKIKDDQVQKSGIEVEDLKGRCKRGGGGKRGIE